jgi:predicted nucleotidyltransferase
VATLLPEVEHSLSEHASRWPEVEVLVLFGSGASGKLADTSDLDLYVRLAHGAPFDPEAERRFRDGAERTSKREIDIVIERPETSVILRREVAAKGRVLFERRPGAARQFVVDAIRDYVDLEPYLSRIGAAIRARAIAEGASAIERLAELSPSAKGRSDGG